MRRKESSSTRYTIPRLRNILYGLSPARTVSYSHQEPKASHRLRATLRHVTATREFTRQKGAPSVMTVITDESTGTSVQAD